MVQPFRWSGSIQMALLSFGSSGSADILSRPIRISTGAPSTTHRRIVDVFSLPTLMRSTAACVAVRVPSVNQEKERLSALLPLPSSGVMCSSRQSAGVMVELGAPLS